MAEKLREIDCPRDSSHRMTVLYTSIEVQGEVIKWSPTRVVCHGGCQQFEQGEVPNIDGPEI